MVSIAASQAVGPGSIPGWRNFNFTYQDHLYYLAIMINFKCYIHIKNVSLDIIEYGLCNYLSRLVDVDPLSYNRFYKAFLAELV